MKFKSFILLILIIPAIAFSNSKPQNISPISLTASDGTGLHLRKLKIKAFVDGISAFTELELTFHNPENRTREGRFSMLLSPNASISRFAMKIHNRWQEGEVVEKQFARRVYEDFLHRKQDPALLEQDSGNFFRARVFPINANSEKKLILSYSETLKNVDSTYSFPLRGLPKLQNLEIQVFYKGENTPKQTSKSSLGGTEKEWKIFEVNKKEYMPLENFNLSIKAAQKEFYSLRNKDLCAIKFMPVSASNTNKRENIKNWVILIDTSASQAINYSNNILKITSLLKQIKKDDKNSKLTVLAFDNNVEKIADIHKDADIQLIGTFLKNRMPLGASDFEKAFQYINTLKQPESRLLIISDCSPTAGTTDIKELSDLLDKTKNIKRTDCYSLSAYQDKSLMTSLSLSSSSPGKVLSYTNSESKVKNVLFNKTVKKISINIPGATWFWPKEFKAIQPGDEAVVFANIPENITLILEIENKQIKLQPESANYLLLKREASKARINKLLDAENSTNDKDLKEAFHNQVIKLSENERVLSPYTALLILETENDYRRYNIKRDALTNILTIGTGGLKTIERKGITSPPMPRPIPIPLPRPPVSPMPLLEKNEEVSMVRGIARKLKNITGDAKGSRQDSASPLMGSMPQEAFEDSVDSLETSSSDEEGISNNINPERELFKALPDVQENTQDKRIIIENVENINIVVIPVITRHIYPDKKNSNNTLPWTGKYQTFKGILQKGSQKNAKIFALNWLIENPGDALAYISLGEAESSIGNMKEAGRAYASLIDLFPSRADIRRWSAQRLMELKNEQLLVIDCLKKALEQRKDHPSVFHMLAISLFANGQIKESINVLTEGLHQKFNSRFGNVKRILKDDLNMILGTQQKYNFISQPIIQDIIRNYNLHPTTKTELRLIMTWETDANDVDFHIYDKHNNHASYQHKNLSSGGTLYEDLTRGYGPECFAIQNPQAFPYRMQAHYYSRGPMGYGMGALQIIKINQSGKINIENRPFIIMQDGAFIDLGTVQ